MTGSRADRVADVVRRTLAQLLREELRDPRVGFVTLTGVKLSPDLRHALVFVTVLDRDDREGSLRALNRAVPFLRRSLARRGGLRFTPQLRFLYDDGVESGQRVEGILSRIREERSAEEWSAAEQEEIHGDETG